jgi:hypothetical protein
MLPRADSSVVVSLSGLGPLLTFRYCNDSSCESAVPLVGDASEAVGKAGLAELNSNDEGGGGDALCMVTGSTALSSEAAAVVCEVSKQLTNLPSRP